MTLCGRAGENVARQKSAMVKVGNVWYVKSSIEEGNNGEK